MSDLAVAAKPAGSLPYTKDDFVSGQDVRWCPGCGDYSILAMMQRTLAKFDVPREEYVFVSGIGCSSRFPYYMNTYGFHTIHGRALTIATGLKAVNPKLKVWVITGDGDGLSIGGNHLIHALRRNIDLNVLLVNNQIYGLTKGQYSPTSELGKVTKSSPYGSIEHPINALCLAIASEASFVARTVDTDPKHMGTVFEKALLHKGISFVEIYQNCIIFNDKAFGPVTGRETKDDRMVYLEDGKPLVFGKDRNKAIRIHRLKTEVVDVEEAKAKNLELLTHHENESDQTHAYLLTQMRYPEMPVPFGIFRSVEKPTYDEMMDKQVKQAVAKYGEGKLEKLLYGSETWTVKERKPIATSKIQAAEEVPIPDVPVNQPLSAHSKKEKTSRAMMAAPISDLVDGEGLITAGRKDRVLDLAEKLRKQEQDCLLITENDRLVGLLSIRDLLLRFALKYKDLSKVTAEQIMTKNVETVRPQDPVAKVVGIMSMGGYRHVPVLSDDGKPIGIIAIRDVLCYLEHR